MIGNAALPRETVLSVKAKRVVAQFGSALDWGSRGRRFKSCQPDQTIRAGQKLIVSDLLCLIQFGVTHKSWTDS